MLISRLAVIVYLSLHASSVFSFVFFFFKQKTAYEMRISDWSSDVCSSDLLAAEVGVGQSMYAIERYTSVNDLGTAVLFQQLIEHPVRRIVVASSMSIYGEGLYQSADGRLIETAERQPRAASGSWAPRSEEHTSELQSLMRISYDGLC